eukprot:scaffold4663_cov42-Cyclotella_meneghiniana.AAC.1
MAANESHTPASIRPICQSSGRTRVGSRGPVAWPWITAMLVVCRRRGRGWSVDGGRLVQVFT